MKNSASSSPGLPHLQFLTLLSASMLHKLEVGMRVPQKHSCPLLTCKTCSFASISSLFLSSFSICGYNTLRSAWATACARCAFHFSTKRLNSSQRGGDKGRRREWEEKREEKSERRERIVMRREEGKGDELTKTENACTQSFTLQNSCRISSKQVCVTVVLRQLKRIILCEMYFQYHCDNTRTAVYSKVESIEHIRIHIGTQLPH